MHVSRTHAVNWWLHKVDDREHSSSSFFAGVIYRLYMLGYLLRFNHQYMPVGHAVLSFIVAIHFSHGLLVLSHAQSHLRTSGLVIPIGRSPVVVLEPVPEDAGFGF